MEGGKINLAIIMGGQSSEHEVSLNSGTNILKGLDKSKYNIKIVKIQKNGTWLVSPGYVQNFLEKTDVNFIEKVLRGVSSLSTNTALDKLKTQIDVAFLALHGKYGEDGIIQAALDLNKIPYQGSGVLSSALAMDKIRSAEIYEFHGLTAPRYIDFTRENLTDKEKMIYYFLKENKLAVLKPSDDGSSAGTFIIQDKDEFLKKLDEAFKVSDNLMIQEFIKGYEVTCGVLDTEDKPQALPPTQIVANAGQFYDYKSKYEQGGSTHLVPAPFEDELLERIKQSALLAHKILKCEGLSRTDMIIKGEKIYVLETNTLPGFTSTSLYPEEVQAAGISYSKLLDKLVQHALNKINA